MARSGSTFDRPKHPDLLAPRAVAGEALPAFPSHQHQFLLDQLLHTRAADITQSFATRN